MTYSCRYMNIISITSAPHSLIMNAQFIPYTLAQNANGIVKTRSKMKKKKKELHHTKYSCFYNNFLSLFLSYFFFLFCFVLLFFFCLFLFLRFFIWIVRTELFLHLLRLRKRTFSRLMPQKKKKRKLLLLSIQFGYIFLFCSFLFFSNPRIEELNNGKIYA